MKREINEIDLIRKGDGTIWIYKNRKNSASFTVSNDGNIFYDDPFGNYMTSSPRSIRINYQHFTLRDNGDEIKKSDGTRMIMMPKHEIQEIANKTFYADGQFHAIDFLTYTITEENL